MLEYLTANNKSHNKWLSDVLKWGPENPDQGR